MYPYCSAGMGHTDTLVTIDNILEQIEKEQVVDVPGAITKIRQRRMKMVQTPMSCMAKCTNIKGVPSLDKSTLPYICISWFLSVSSCYIASIVQVQFVFIHDAILESVTCGDTQIAATNLRVAIIKVKKRDHQNQLIAFQHQFKVGPSHSQ